MFKNDFWSEEEIDYVRKNYLKMTYAEMGNILGRTRTAVMVKCNRIGIKLPEKYIFNKNFFSKIDSEEKSYWLGFIYADGYISNKYELGIQLQQNDYYHLEKFNKHLEGNLPVKKFIKSGGFVENSPICTIRIYSKKVFDDLVNIGLMPNKSLTVKFPNIEKEFLRHFIRGYFDGNGCIHVDKTKNLVKVKFTSGSNDFIIALQNILNDLEIKTTYMHPKKNIYELSIPNKFSTRKFLEYIYDDSNVYLERKHDFYLKHKDLLIYLYDGWNKR